MAPQAKPTGGHATVTLNDGSTETYDTDRPIYLYRLSQVYDVGDDTADTAQNIQRGMMVIWVAAGMPHLVNGDRSQAAAVAAMEKWLEDDVAAIDRGDADPPANRQQRRQSRKSRG